LQAVNPDSPYADQLLWLAADCQQRRGRSDQAAATLHALLKDYPGSPLVPRAQAALTRLEK
jgi:TolA-binding protein